MSFPQVIVQTPQISHLLCDNKSNTVQLTVVILGVKWLIAEHRTCIAELKRLKAMIADLAKYIETLHEKGRSLLNSYLALKKHLDELRSQISMLKGENEQQKVNWQ
jgi:hypothetical protein